MPPSARTSDSAAGRLASAPTNGLRGADVFAAASRENDEVAVHLFSDELPMYRLVDSWLLEQKLEDDLASFEPFKSATTGEHQVLRVVQGPPER